MWPLLLIVGGVALYFYFYPPTIAAAPTVGVQEKRKFHIVKSGEWLSKIAPMYGLSLPDLNALNPTFKPLGPRDPKTLQVGERIRVA